MKEICHLDIETFSEVDLKAEGMYKYAASETTEILCAAYAFGDGPVHLWVPTPLAQLPDSVRETLVRGLPTSAPMDEGANVLTGGQPPADLSAWIAAGKSVAAHNAAFERRVLGGPAGRRLGFPTLLIEQMVCTAAKAASHGLPRHLEGAAAALGGAQKNETGKNAMRALCRPRTGAVRRWTLETAPEKYAEMYLYCIDDVRAERSVDNQVPDLTPEEVTLWQLDQVMNDRGVEADLASVQHAKAIVIDLRAEMAAIAAKITGGITLTQTGKLADWIRANGYPQLKDLTAPILAAAALDPTCPDLIKRIILLRASYAMKAVDKYEVIERMAGEDARLRGMFMFYGANTGRWSSTGVQLHNLFRTLEGIDSSVAIEAFAARDADWIKTLYPDHPPMAVLASCVRAALVAGEGRELQCLDYSQIEARIVPWLAGQENVLKIFASGEDIYMHTAALMFGKPVELVTKEERFFGKIAVLALGYQGGSGAFQSMARLYGKHIDVMLAESIKNGWRNVNKRVVQLWYDLEACAINAVKNPGKAYGLTNKLIAFKVIGRWLYMRLPSGRRIAYFEPRIVDDKLTYMGIDTYTRQWGRVDTYGGRLLQNAAEGVARDLLAAALLRFEKFNYRPLGSVHDEAITEPRVGYGSLEEAHKLFIEEQSWARGLPVAAEGWRGRRYRK